MKGRTVAVVRRCRKCWAEYVVEPDEPVTVCEPCFTVIWMRCAFEVLVKHVQPARAVNRQFDHEFSPPRAPWRLDA